jgi:NAD(P)-dependent dehydrogenase (short-subunit alcohol dehydrogenase family)
MKTVVVTGASTGIGWGCVKVLIAGGFRVFGSVRRQADAERLRAEFGANFLPLIFDVTDAAAVAAGAAQVDAALGGASLFGLVNNAGIAVPGPLLLVKIEDFERQIAVNLTGQLIVTQAFAPLLGVDRSRNGGPGRIVMISSVSGKNARPFLGPYSASKFALEGMSESLRRELLVFGLDVIIVAPGTVATPIWDRANATDVAPFAGTPYAHALEKLKLYMVTNGKKGLPPERLGEVVKSALTAANPKTRYTVTPHPIENWLLNTLPKRLVDNMIARRLGMK